MDDKEGEFRQDYGQSQRPEMKTIEDQQVRHLLHSQSCSAKASDGFVSGTVIGATMSGLTGLARANLVQMRFPAALQAVIGATIVGGLSFGVALGTYQGAVCTLRQVRGVDDIKNPMLAGALVGAMSEIPVFLRGLVVTKADVLLAEQGMHVMRPRPRFLTNAVGGAVVCGLFYTVGVGMRSAPSPQPQGHPQSPQAPSRPPLEGEEELATSNSLESDSADSDELLINDQPSGEVLESEDLRWGTE